MSSRGRVSGGGRRRTQAGEAAELELDEPAEVEAADEPEEPDDELSAEPDDPDEPDEPDELAAGASLELPEPPVEDLLSVL